MRGDPPGAATSPLVVVPFTLWARGRLRRAGVLRATRPRDPAVGLGARGGASGDGGYRSAAAVIASATGLRAVLLASVELTE